MAHDNNIEYKYDYGDPVWTKMKGYCPWPSRIAYPNESRLENKDKKHIKPYYLVYFFGSHNFAWMEESCMRPYKEFEDENKKKGKKTQTFKAGLREVDEYIAKGGKATLQQAQEEEEDEEEEADASPDEAGDNLSNDASNLDGGLPSINEEIAIIQNKKPVPPSASSKISKNLHHSHNDSPSHTSPVPASVQKDYSRTPFKNSRKAAKGDDTTTELTSPTKRFKGTDDNLGVSSLSSPTVTPSKPVPSRGASRAVMMNTAQRAELPVLDTPQISLSSITTKQKDITPSSLKFGFIGLGMMGQRLVKQLMDTGHQVTVWNRNRDKVKIFEEAGAAGATTPSDVVMASDITFSCVSDPSASKEILFGQFGVLGGIGPDKSYVELSSIDPETSNDISDAVISKEGRFLAAPIIYSGKSSAESGDLIVVASGDKKVYQDCRSCFQAIAKRSFYLGPDCGSALRMHLILSSFFGAIVGALGECFQMIDRFGLTRSDFTEILKLSSMNSALVEKNLERLTTKRMDVDMPLHYLQKDLRMMINMAEEKAQSCPITAIVNEVFKNKRTFGSEDDTCALFFSAGSGL